MLIFWDSQHLAISRCVLAPYIILFMPKSPQPFSQNPLVPLLLLPFIANPSSKKHRRENERQKWRRAKSLGGEGPIKRGPLSLQRMRPEMEEDERSGKKKNCSLYFLKIDFSLTPRGGLTGRQVGVWIEGGRELKEEGRLFQTQKQMKEVFWQNRQCDGDTHYKQGTHCLTNTNPC